MKVSLSVFVIVTPAFALWKNLLDGRIVCVKMSQNVHGSRFRTLLPEILGK